jgi:hypothetical protein
MKLVKAIWILVSAFLLASCGGSGGAGDSPFTPGGGGGGGSGSAVVADLVLSLNKSRLANTGSDSVTVVATAIDASRNALGNVPVTISADADAIVSATNTATEADGTLTATLTIGANRSNRVITVTAISGAISKATTVQVSGTRISSVLNPAVLAPSSAGNVQYRVVDEAGNPMANQSVQVTAAGLNPSQATGTTGSNGEYVFNYTASSTAGSYPITVNIAGASDVQTLQVQTTSTVPNVTAPIISASVSANPSVVAVNLSGSSTNRSEIRALFLGAGNVPIPNVRVRFDLAGDAQNIGGTFTAGSTQTLYSDSNGVVTTAYVPSTRSSPTDGVTVRACYGVSDTDPNLLNCTTSATETLTVTSEPLNVTIGTNATILVGTLTYTKQFNVSVVDSSGAAKPDVNIVASVDLPVYRKGQYAVGANGWFKTGALPSGDEVICQNEDTNRNGVLESGEDINGNGALEPRKADVRVSLLSNKTDAKGSAILEVTYDQDHGSWVDAVITVSASGISGTEGRAVYVLSPVPVDVTQVRNTGATPAFFRSPYGVTASCTSPN